ncbi:hypothetical protein [Paludisphaera borealis]|uniref:Uncharacterized protein n=1 Tax=Paludisphaera borealis TaxID=1387353 RepID=A0A1U7CTC5_9BACT|nr:hypothetical protein [Paludisphaera borealis]APW62133.1 hypothetical protein BSF38_03665 [Paludisphaera borealis]
MFGTIRYEQAVYGSFPFWNRGYAVLARSEGCLPEWLEAMRNACQGFGERPSGVESFRSHFATPVGRAQWMIVQADSLGCDDQGRPGATAFHAVFVTSWTYRRANADPLVFVPAFRADWTLDDQERPLPQGALKVVASREDPAAALDPRVEPIVSALVRGRRAIIQSPTPADALIRSVWRRLSGRTRRKTSVATWAFGDANRFDLLATPRIGGLTLDGSELVLPLDSPQPRP